MMMMKWSSTAGLVCCVMSMSILLQLGGARGGAISPQACDSITSNPCQAMVGYMASANFEVAHVASLFNLTNYTSLLGPNDIDLSLPNLSQLLLPPAREKPYLIPAHTCGCLGGTRVVTSINYTVVAGDTLSAIATQYLNLVTYEEIANVSSIPNPDLIQIGQELLIPIPCSCFDNQSINGLQLSLSYQIQDTDSLSKIAQLYNTSTARLQDLNVNASNGFEAGQVLFVPLQVCKANFSSGVVDEKLTVVEGTYELTADGCVQCICNNGTLRCISTAPSSLGNKCSNFTCSNSSLVLGASNSSVQASGECLVESCVYKGFNTQSGIVASLEVEQERTCPVAPPPETFYKPPPGLVPAPSQNPSPTTLSPPPTPSTPPTPPVATPPSSAASCLVTMSLSAWWWYLLLPML